MTYEPNSFYRFIQDLGGGLTTSDVEVEVEVGYKGGGGANSTEVCGEISNSDVGNPNED